MTQHRTALVLAAGLGSRHDTDGRDLPKPLLPVAGRSMILRTLDSVQLAGCDRAIIVVGYRGQDVENAIRASYSGPLVIDFVQNSAFRKGNGLSVLAAGPKLPDDFMLVMADHVFAPDIMRHLGRISRREDDGILAVDFKLTSIFDMADATKVLVGDDQRIRRIGKNLSSYNAVDCGIFLLGAGFLDALADLNRKHSDASVTAAVQMVAEQGRMIIADIGDAWWQDVDDHAMLAAAERHLVSLRKSVRSHEGPTND